MRNRPRIGRWIASALTVSVVACGTTNLAIFTADPSASDSGTPSDDATFSRDAPRADGGGDGAGDDGGDANQSSGDGSAPVYACGDSVVTSCAADCPGQPSMCRATGACVTTCSDCAGARIACFMCDSDGLNPVGTCEVENDAGYCLNGDYAPGSACSCVNGDASACPGDYQKCIAPDAGVYACHSCGEPGTQGGPTCKNGKMCDFGGSPTDHLTCH